MAPGDTARLYLQVDVVDPEELVSGNPCAIYVAALAPTHVQPSG
ncbi:MAG TPA: hypothetical protein VES19_04595 [Candidatus Limnocylindrales bacterium]|nr:hypothetical protein [Candidatus Limnocylindrales bacterium]